MTTPNPQALIKGLQLFRNAQEMHAAKALAAAAEAYRQALLLLPDHPTILAGYGSLAEEVGDWKSAERIYRRLMSVSKLTNLDAKLGLALFNLERYEEAIPLLEAYAQRNPADAALRRFLSTACFRIARFDEAMQHARAAWAQEAHVDAICLMMATQLELGDGDVMAPLVEEALARFPDHWQVRKLAAEHLLKAGDYARGFRYFTEMRISPDGAQNYLDRLDIPTWDGKPFAGTLLVGAEQGIGDEILTASMYGNIAALGQPALIEADTRLLPLLRRSWPTLEFVARNEGTLARHAGREPGCRKIISGDLGRHFRSTPGSFAGLRPWLQADPEKTAAFRARYQARWPGARLAGLSWKSQRVLKSGVRKDVPVTEFAALLRLAGTQFISLQYGEVANDIASLGNDGHRLFVDPDVDTMNDIDTLFAQVAALDLVITTSNVTAHVAGAQGKPCIVLLPRRRPVIWYWGYGGDSTPWYPHSRLLRNPRDEDWSAFTGAIARDLDELADGLTAASPESTRL